MAGDLMMVGAATVFVVSDIEKSLAYYRDVLGFAVTFQYGSPTFYACLCRDDVALHLNAAHQTKRLPGNGAVCVFVRDVGMRDFDVLDPDGNQLVFGMGSEHAS